MGKRRSASTKITEEPGLDLARRRFEPLASFLEHLGKNVADHKPWFSLKIQDDMRKIAQHTFETKYLLCKNGAECLSLDFTLVGPEADKILFQRHKRSSPRDMSANSEQVDLHVYRLDEMDQLKQVVENKVISYTSG